MDKNQINQIAENVSDAEQVPDVVFQLTQDCKLLLAEVERIEARHKADQKAVEEANQLAETYMKRCQELYDKLKKAEKASSGFTGYISEMMNRVSEIKADVSTSGIYAWESIERVLRDEKLKYLETYKTKDLVDELKKREGVKTSIVETHMKLTHYVEGPAIVLTVID